MSKLPNMPSGPGCPEIHRAKKRKQQSSSSSKPHQEAPDPRKHTASLMETALFSPSSLFHGGDDDGEGGREEMQEDSKEENQEQAYVERVHEFPGMELRVREFSFHQLNANLLWPGTFSFTEWLVKNQSILHGQLILELGSGTGALAIFLRRTFGVDITTSDYDDKEIEDNIAYNCRINNVDVLPHIRHSWGDPFPISEPDWDIIIASDILLYVKQYPNLVKTLCFLLKSYKPQGQKDCAGISPNQRTFTTTSGTEVQLKSPVFLMSWRRRIGPDESLFFTGCEEAGLKVQHVGARVYIISRKD